MFYNQELESKQLVIKAGKILSQKGLVERTWGNVSSRINEQYLAISPSGASYSKLTLDDIPVVNLKNLSFIGNKRPSSELLIHSTIYTRYKKASFILHTHQRFASLLSLLFSNKLGSIEVLNEYKSILGDTIPIAEYAEAGTKEISESIMRAFVNTKDHSSDISKGIVLMAAHGLVCFAPSFDEAFFMVETLENFAKSLVLNILKQNGIFLEKNGELKTYSKDNFYNNSKTASINDLFSTIFTNLPSISFITLSNLPTSQYISKMLKTQNFTNTTELSLAESSFKGIPTYFDDAAQIIGEVTPIIYEIEALEKTPKTLFESYNTLVVEGAGVLCFSQKEDETLYMASIFEKNALAFLLSLHNPKIFPLIKENARSLHTSFMQGYSKLKND
ncbi:MAG: class II aldolase/adducin family protein [Treponema sp.]